MSPSAAESAGLHFPTDWLARIGDSVGESFGFVFKDPRWVQKVIIGSIVVVASFFLVGVVLLAGYALRLARRVRDEETLPLPEWDDWGDLLVDGLKALLIYAGHVVPLGLLGGVLVLAASGAISLAARSGELPDGIQILIVMALFAGALLFAVAILVISIVLIVSFVRFVETDELRDAFDLPTIRDELRNNLFEYLVVFWTITLSNFVAQFGFVAFCVGMFPAAFWCVAVMGHAVGSLAARRSMVEASEA